jgi:L-asparaginase
MKKKRKILVIFTGGTIASSVRDKVASPNKKSFQSLYNYVKQFFLHKDIELTCIEPWGIPGEDSSNLDPGNWIKITSIIVKELENQLDGVLILYGTDTMAYLASWLSLCFPKIHIPVILTGSQLTLDYMPEDVTVNVPGAAQVVYYHFPGVWIYCNWKLYPGERAHKAHAIHPDVFTATNGIPVYFNMDWALKSGEKMIKTLPYQTPDWLKKILSYPVEKVKEICKKISWLMCIPGTEPEISPTSKIICVYGFGAGNAPVTVLDNVRKRFEGQENKPCIIACSQAEGDIKKPDYYQKVGIAWLAKDGFKVWGQMDYPIEFIHALACYALLIDYENPGPILSRYIQDYSRRMSLKN